MSDQPPPESRDLAGLGDEPLRRSDLQLMQQALRGDWPLPPATKHWILKEVAALAETSKSKRLKLGALKVLMAASLINVKQQTLDLARERFEFEREGGKSDVTAADAVREMMAAAQRYERDHPDSDPGDRGGAPEVPDGPGPV